MLVFITHPKYFDKRKIARKKIDLIYIFNSKKLYSQLSEKYKCVNIGKDGKIKQENFFPQAKKYKRITKEKFIDLKIGIVKYFAKKKHSVQRKYYVMLKGPYSDPLMHYGFHKAKKSEFNEGTMILDAMIVNYIAEIFRLEKGEEFTNKNKRYIELLLNFSHSFYRAYVYSLGYERGMEIFSEVFKFNYFKKVSLYYTFNKFDLYQDRFHFNYLKVLSRLFVEDIHNNNIEEFIQKNITYYKENGWL